MKQVRRIAAEGKYSGTKFLKTLSLVFLGQKLHKTSILYIATSVYAIFDKFRCETILFR